MSEQKLDSILRGLGIINSSLKKESKCAHTFESRSREVDEILPALFTLQHGINKLSQDASGQYKYCSYSNIRKEIDPWLKELNLMVYHYQDSIDGQPISLTKIEHISGQFVQSRAPIKLPPSPPFKSTQACGDYQKAYGGAISYMNRYLLLSLLGQKPEKDPDEYR